MIYFISSFLLAGDTLWYNMKNTFILECENKGICYKVEYIGDWWTSDW